MTKQRIAAVRKLERLGYTFAAGDWHAPVLATPTSAQADAIHAILVQRADVLEGCPEGSEEERELAALADAVEAYETVPWPKTAPVAGRRNLTEASGGISVNA